jgi:hypothetical protein
LILKFIRSDLNRKIVLQNGKLIGENLTNYLSDCIDMVERYVSVRREGTLCLWRGELCFPPAWNVGPLLSLSFSLFFLYNFFLLLRGEAEVVLTPKWCSLDHATRLICPSFVCVNSDPKWPTRVFCVLSDLPGNLLNSQNENTRKYDR